MKIVSLGTRLAFAVALAGCGSSAPPPTNPIDPAVMAEGPPAPAEDHAGHAHHHPPPDADPVAAVPDAPPTPDPAQLKADLLKAETVAFEQAKPVFDTFCGSCHVQGARKAKKKALGHFDMTSYPFGGHHADDITASLRKVLGVDGSKPTMPKGKPGSVQGDDLAAIVAWAEAFDAATAGGAHGAPAAHDGHGGHAH